MLRVSVLINSKDRPQVLDRCLQSVLGQAYEPFEVWVLDDASSGCRLGQELAPHSNDVRLQIVRVEESLGVARGRNLLMQQATGDIFVVIDDDAHFADDQVLCRLVEFFQAQPGAGIVACKIIKHLPASNELQVPFKQQTLRRHPSIAEQMQLVSHFIGAGHAIRREVIDTCGMYSNELTFGEEEQDLSYRVIEAGFEIYYLPEVIVHHYPQPSVVAKSGRHSHPELYYHVRNRFFLAYKYLPWRYVPIYLSIWLIRYGLRGVKAGAIKELLGGGWSGLRLLRQCNRTPLSSNALRYLKQNYGRLWY